MECFALFCTNVSAGIVTKYRHRLSTNRSFRRTTSAGWVHASRNSLTKWLGTTDSSGKFIHAHSYAWDCSNGMLCSLVNKFRTKTASKRVFGGWVGTSVLVIRLNTGTDLKLSECKFCCWLPNGATYEVAIMRAGDGFHLHSAFSGSPGNVTGSIWSWAF